MKPAGFVVAFAICGMIGSGCALAVGAAGGAGGAVYVKGRLQEYLDSPMVEVQAATKTALTDLGLPVLDDEVKKKKVEIKSVYADGKDVWIDILPVTTESSRIIVRVGMFGDQSRSRDILNKVKAYL